MNDGKKCGVSAFVVVGEKKNRGEIVAASGGDDDIAEEYDDIDDQVDYVSEELDLSVLGGTLTMGGTMSLTMDGSVVPHEAGGGANDDHDAEHGSSSGGRRGGARATDKATRSGGSSSCGSGTCDLSGAADREGSDLGRTRDDDRQHSDADGHAAGKDKNNGSGRGNNRGGRVGANGTTIDRGAAAATGVADGAEEDEDLADRLLAAAATRDDLPALDRIGDGRGETYPSEGPQTNQIQKDSSNNQKQQAIRQQAVQQQSLRQMKQQSSLPQQTKQPIHFQTPQKNTENSSTERGNDLSSEHLQSNHTIDELQSPAHLSTPTNPTHVDTSIPENSAEKDTQSASNQEEKPICPGIGEGAKALTFDELVEKAMRESQQTASPQKASPKKSTFLKRGDRGGRPIAYLLAKQKAAERSHGADPENTENPPQDKTKRVPDSKASELKVSFTGIESVPKNVSEAPKPSSNQNSLRKATSAQAIGTQAPQRTDFELEKSNLDGKPTGKPMTNSGRNPQMDFKSILSSKKGSASEISKQAPGDPDKSNLPEKSIITHPSQNKQNSNRSSQVMIQQPLVPPVEPPKTSSLQDRSALALIEQKLLASAMPASQWLQWKQQQNKELLEFENLEAQILTCQNNTSKKTPPTLNGQDSMVFGDEDAWGSVEDPVAHSALNLLSKSKASSDQNFAGATPGASSLVTRVFHLQQPTTANPVTLNARGSASAPATLKKTSNAKVKEREIAEKQKILEEEISKYRQENDKLKRIREDHEVLLQQLKADKASFEREKAAQLEQFEKFKEDELKKIKRERVQSIARKSDSEKKLKDDLEALQNQYLQLDTEFKSQKAKYQGALDRSKKRIEELTAQVSELEQEVRFHEKRALDIAQERTSTIQQKPSETRQKAPPPVVRTTELSNIATPTAPVPADESGPPFQEQVGWLTKEVTSPRGDTLLKENCSQDGKIERIFASGRRTLQFTNGTRKTILPDGHSCVYFKNGDIKQVFPDSKNIYYYANANTTHATFPDGLQVYYFANRQIEKHFPDGRKEITFPDGTQKQIFPNGDEENVFPDGTVQRISSSGESTVSFQPQTSSVPQPPISSSTTPPAAAATTTTLNRFAPQSHNSSTNSIFSTFSTASSQPRPGPLLAPLQYPPGYSPAVVNGNSNIQSRILQQPTPAKPVSFSNRSRRGVVGGY
ncbi:centromere protein J [Pelomyxa schiedti]|nr:centromere protein J [Pelomyxa schiedti]